MEKQRKDNLYGSLILMLCAIIWGSSFVAQTTGAEHVGPFTFICARSLLGAAALLPVIGVSGAFRKKKGISNKMTAEDKRTLVKGGAVCGIVLFFASNLQQLGIDG